jgi:DNA-binding PadR family transcriptional regulator
MLTAALFSVVQGLDPVGKYFLVRFIQCLGTFGPVDLGVKEYAKRFGLSDSQVSAALDALVATGVLGCSTKPNGRGRPRTCYELTDDFRRGLHTRFVQPATVHESAVGTLLEHEARKRRDTGQTTEKQREDIAPLAELRSKRHFGQLSVVNRLLLSILLCRADRFGVVRDLGSTELRMLTGLDADGLKHRTQRLIDLGLIRTYVPGATSRLFLSKKKSIYVINLNHLEFSGGGVSVSVFLCYSDDFELARHLKDTFLQLRAMERDIDRHLAMLRLNPVAKLFQGQRFSFFPLLQAILEACAAHLLSKYWAKLVYPIGKKPVGFEEIREMISKEFRAEVFSLESGSREGQAVMETLCIGACELAAFIKERLSKVSGPPFEAMDYFIMPRPLGNRYSPLGLLALPHLSSGTGGEAIVKIIPNEDLPIMSFAHEADIPLEDRYGYGLLTRPSGKANAS